MISIDTEVVVVLVGEPATKFYVHEKLLIEQSEFFARTLNGEWKESQERLVKLPTVKVKTFRIWVKWLYTSRFYFATDAEVPNKKNLTYEQDEIFRWSDCYALGTYLQDIDFKDVGIDTLIEGYVAGQKSHVDHLIVIYEHSHKHSAHRTFMVDISLYYASLGGCSEVSECLPQAFLYDYIAAVEPILGKGLPKCKITDFQKDLCKYHEHGKDKPCYMTKPKYGF